MSSDTDVVGTYGTRNKRRRIIEDNSISLESDFEQSGVTQSLSTRSFEGGEQRNTALHGRNLDKALKSILSQAPKMKNRKDVGKGMLESVDVTPLADDEASSSNVAGVPTNGRTSSISISSSSRDTTPSSSFGGHDIAPFIEYFQKEADAGNHTKSVREEALKVLREWRSEWYQEDKRIRELKRKIKLHQVAHADAPTPPTKTIEKGRRRTSGTPVSESDKKEETPKPTVHTESDASNPSGTRSPSKESSGSIIGPNGLTGSYWETSTNDMGRGNRRKYRP
jgi:hypothetical protein